MLARAMQATASNGSKIVLYNVRQFRMGGVVGPAAALHLDCPGGGGGGAGHKELRALYGGRGGPRSYALCMSLGPG